MTPGLPSDDASEVAEGDAEFGGECALGFTSSGSPPNLGDLLRRKDVGGTSADRPLPHVLELVSEHQMVGSYTRRVVAAVKDVFPLRDWSIGDCIGEAVGHGVVATGLELPVPGPVAISGPLPTSLALANLRPEAGDIIATDAKHDGWITVGPPSMVMAGAPAASEHDAFATSDGTRFHNQEYSTHVRP